MTTDAPRFLRYDAGDAEKYRRLLQDDLSPFKSTMFKDVFVYAAAYGYRHGLRKPLEHPQPNIPLSALSTDDLWILRALAIAETDSLEILNDERAAYEIAEAYANGALETLYLEVLGGKPGEPYKRMTQEMLEKVKEMEGEFA